ncbi:MAG: hypothetical protein BWX69_03180 [Planctomycetes bacterium ADurb.Bin069]|nr:MAG: hypothetical protein BWX69_03180 [Planctomycetes bacterium ADurb.Bin069]
MELETLLEAAQNRNRILHRWRRDQHGLKTALEGGILLEVLAVLIDGGGADHVQLAPGKGGLQHVARIDGALGLAGADDGVQLVDEENDAAVAADDLAEHGLEPFLELAAELGAGHQRAHVEGEDGLVLEPLGHVAPHDALREPLDDGGLADAGFADQDRIVLGLAGEHANRAADFGVAADDGLQLALAGQSHQIETVLLQRLNRGLGVGA